MAVAVAVAVWVYSYCSVPGPTQNNRLFFHCGSVSGLCINFDRNKVLKGLGATTMYKLLEDNKISWGVYMHDLSSLLYFKDFRSKPMLSNGQRCRYPLPAASPHLTCALRCAVLCCAVLC